MANRPSSIDRMAPEVRDWIGRLRDQGRTIDEIIVKLRELDVEALPSRSALGRHLKEADFVAAELRKTRTIADVVVRQLGDAQPEKTTRMNIELMHNVLFKIATQTDEESGEAITFTPMEAMLMAKSLDHLGKAAKDDTARMITVEKRAEEKAKKEAVEKAAKAIKEEAAANGGVVDPTAVLKRIRAEVYGIHE